MGYLIQRPGVSTALQQFFRLTGKLPLELEPFIIGTVQVADLSLAQTPPIVRSASAAWGEAAVVGELPTFSFEAVPGTLCHIRRINIEQFSGAGVNFRAHFGPSVATPHGFNQQTTRYTDGRLTGFEEPSGVLFTGTQVGALAATEWRLNLPAAGNITITPNNWIVGSRDLTLFGFLELQIGTANIATGGSFEWDEYQVF